MVFESGFVPGRPGCEGRWILTVSKTHGAVMLKVFHKFCLALPELSQICTVELMLLIVKTLVTPAGLKEE